jgi:hypothetical protein
LHYVAEIVKEEINELAIDSFKLLLENFELCIELLSHKEINIVEKAS